MLLFWQSDSPYSGGVFFLYVLFLAVEHVLIDYIALLPSPPVCLAQQSDCIT